MRVIASILASSDESGIVKAVLFVIVLIIWGISALVKTINVARNQSARRNVAPPRMPPVPLQPARPVASPLPPRMGQRPVALPPLPALITAAPSRRAAPQRTVAAPQASMPAVPAARPPASQRQTAPAAAPPAAATKAPPRVSGFVDLLKPRTVRAQFILAEVLQPPLALRTRRSF